MDRRNQKYIWIFWVILSLLALALRWQILAVTVEFPGDGASRSLEAYSWSLKPHWIMSGYWLPGHLYMVGMSNWLIHDPSVAGRILNCLLGVITIPVVFFLTLSLFGLFEAIVVAFTVAFWPLHIGLSTTTLTEVPFILFFLTAWLILLKIPSSPNLFFSGRYWLFWGLCTGANLIRIEAWGYTCILALLLYLRQRRFLPFVFMLGSLFLLPALWIYQCAVDYGQPLISFMPSADPRNNSIDFFSACSSVSHYAFEYVGPVIFGFGIFALLRLLFVQLRNVQLRKWQSGDCNVAEQFPYWTFLVFTAAASALGIHVAMSWGDNIQQRYLTLFYLLMIIASAYGVRNLSFVNARLSGTVASVKKLVTTSALVSLIWANSVILMQLALCPIIYVTTEHHKEIEHFVAWLKEEKREQNPILSLALNGRALFMPLLEPALVGHFIIINEWWTNLNKAVPEIERLQPQLLVVCEDCGNDMAYMLSILDLKIDPQPVFRDGYLQAFKILPGTIKVKKDGRIPPGLWHH